MRQINKWSEEDRSKLINLVTSNTKNNRTDWKTVSQQIQRTANQCKTYYAVAIKQKIPKECNFKWTEQMQGQLLSCVLIYGKKWSLIQKLQFQNVTTEQLRLKYHSFLKHKQEGLELMELIKQKQSPIEPSQYNQIKKLYEHFKNLANLYEKCQDFDAFDRKALLKANEDINFKECARLLEEIIVKYNIQ
ncbi:Myb-like_DNA-binding domain-containing protein [Hexamita inflata]|uniref:Myb-like DNA-binding domain-containing protein n=1 Tax=Hexamita inflata TaxID=28002 RepID=A0AA86U6A9_9EUKA|nr:Myb-like DNA-binding domain-containing protein [Hexamita inflata]